MARLDERLRKLESRQKPVEQRDDGYREEPFIKDGQPWRRYFNSKFPYITIELPCNGRDDPLDAIGQRVESGEKKPDDLTPEESDCWDTSLMGHLGDQIIKRIHSGELTPEDLTPNERDCWELVTAVREKY